MEVFNVRFDKNKKEAVIRYLLEKINDNAPNIAKTVCEQFGINQNTVYTYINELTDSGVIRKIGRGHYALAENTVQYTLSRSAGELDDEFKVYTSYLLPHLQKLPENVRDIWSYILGEMINNVIDHSEADTLSVQISQSYLLTRFRIADNGVGIFKKIKEHFGMHDLDEAICELFKGKLTTDPAHHSGEGIFFSSRLADKFIICSDGKFFSINKYDNDVLVDLPESAGGTTILVELSNMSNKHAADIFNQYAQVGGGFQVTMIPLKNMFDTAPVSRSQAKRVCQRLDQFEEVILDFDGLSWMGQGFAHQIFIVFQNEHPDICLKPVNMCRDVEQMYLHVIGRSY